MCLMFSCQFWSYFKKMVRQNAFLIWFVVFFCLFVCFQPSRNKCLLATVYVRSCIRHQHESRLGKIFYQCNWRPCDVETKTFGNRYLLRSCDLTCNLLP